LISKTDPDEQVIDLHNILKILRRRLRWIVAIPVAILAVAAIVNWRLTPVYQATSRVEVLPSTSSQSGQSALENLIDPRSALQTQVELIKSPLVLEPAAKELGIEDSTALAKDLSVQLLQGTQIVEIRVEHRDAREARNYANSIANAYVEFRRTRAQETSLAASEAIARQMEGAGSPSSAIGCS
jgi:polysaccharide biosynthesis transport protein